MCWQLKFAKIKSEFWWAKPVCCMFFFTSGKLKRFCPWKSWKFHPSNDYSQAEAQRRWTDFPMPVVGPVDEWQPIFHEALKWLVCVFFNKVQANKNGLNDVKCKWHPLFTWVQWFRRAKGQMKVWKYELVDDRHPILTQDPALRWFVFRSWYGQCQEPWVLSIVFLWISQKFTSFQIMSYDFIGSKDMTCGEDNNFKMGAMEISRYWRCCLLDPFSCISVLYLP